MKNNDSAVFSSVMQFINGYASKDLEACMRVISTSAPVMFFGSNLDEVLRDRESIETALIRDFESISDIHFGEYQQLFTHADNSLASLMIELPISFKVAKESQQCIFRYAFCLKKEGSDAWQIYAVMLSVPFSSETISFDNK